MKASEKINFLVHLINYSHSSTCIVGLFWVAPVTVSDPAAIRVPPPLKFPLTVTFQHDTVSVCPLRFKSPAIIKFL